jgi:DNA replication protein DnaC
MEINYDEFKFEMTEWFHDLANIPKKFRNVNYSHVKNIDGKTMGYKYILKFNEMEKNVLIMGDIFTGKTTLAITMLKQLITAERGKGFYISFPEILSIRKENKSIHAEEAAYTYWGECINSDLLVVDNLGMEVFNNFNREEYIHLLHGFLFSRFDNNKKTIFVTHLRNDVDFIQRYGDLFYKSLNKKTITYTAE